MVQWVREWWQWVSSDVWNEWWVGGLVVMWGMSVGSGFVVRCGMSGMSGSAILPTQPLALTPKTPCRLVQALLWLCRPTSVLVSRLVSQGDHGFVLSLDLA